MIAIRDIIIFLSGVILMYVAFLTHRYFYGKYLLMAKLIQREEPYVARKVNTELPPIDADRFNVMIRQINMHDEFDETYSKRVKEKV